MGVVEAAREEVEFAGAMEGEELRPELAGVSCLGARWSAFAVIPSGGPTLAPLPILERSARRPRDLLLVLVMSGNSRSLTP